MPNPQVDNREKEEEKHEEITKFDVITKIVKDTINSIISNVQKIKRELEEIEKLYKTINVPLQHIGIVETDGKYHITAYGEKILPQFNVNISGKEEKTITASLIVRVYPLDDENREQFRRVNSNIIHNGTRTLIKTEIANEPYIIELIKYVDYDEGEDIIIEDDEDKTTMFYRKVYKHYLTCYSCPEPPRELRNDAPRMGLPEEMSGRADKDAGKGARPIILPVHIIGREKQDKENKENDENEWEEEEIEIPIEEIENDNDEENEDIEELE